MIDKLLTEFVPSLAADPVDFSGRFSVDDSKMVSPIPKMSVDGIDQIAVAESPFAGHYPELSVLGRYPFDPNPV